MFDFNNVLRAFLLSSVATSHFHSTWRMCVTMWRWPWTFRRVKGMDTRLWKLHMLLNLIWKGGKCSEVRLKIGGDRYTNYWIIVSLHYGQESFGGEYLSWMRKWHGCQRSRHFLEREFSGGWGPNHTAGRQAEPWAPIVQDYLVVTRRGQAAPACRWPVASGSRARVPGAQPWNSASVGRRARQARPRRQAAGASVDPSRLLPASDPTIAVELCWSAEPASREGLE